MKRLHIAISLLMIVAMLLLAACAPVAPGGAAQPLMRATKGPPPAR